MIPRRILFFLALLLAALGCSSTKSAGPAAEQTSALRLYVFDCGELTIADPERFGLDRKEIATNMLSVGCYLVAHPNGTLMWDVGAVPDSMLQPGMASVTEGYATIKQPLKAQLAASGYMPAEIDYVAFSHYHYDHTANANDFASATWLVRPIERDAMFADPPLARLTPNRYNLLRDSKTVLINTDDYDVFGDASVVIKSAPGHSPGHQLLYVNLAETGPVVLTGDLYHYPEERTLNRVPNFEVDVEQTKASRKALEAFLQKTGAQLWIQHDYTQFGKLKKAPEYYQ